MDLVSLLVGLLVLLLVLALVFYIIRLMPVDANIRNIIYLFILIVAVVAFLRWMGLL